MLLNVVTEKRVMWDIMVRALHAHREGVPEKVTQASSNMEELH